MDSREIIDRHSDTLSTNDDLVAERQSLQDIRGEVDDDVLGEAATLAGDHTARTFGVAGHDDRLIADARKNVESLVRGRVRGFDRDAGFDIVTSPTKDRITDLDVEDNAAQTRQQARFSFFVDLMWNGLIRGVSCRDYLSHHLNRDLSITIRIDHVVSPFRRRRVDTLVRD
jgi:hypothetical protein